MRQQQLSEICVTMVVRTYGIPMADETDTPYTMPSDIERIVEVNGSPVYAVRTALALDEDTAPRRFEQWLVEWTKSMEIADGRHDGGTDGRNFLCRCQMFGRKVFRKLIQFKP